MLDVADYENTIRTVDPAVVPPPSGWLITNDAPEL
jgi:hypothetical protein